MVPDSSRPTTDDQSQETIQEGKPGQRHARPIVAPRRAGLPAAIDILKMRDFQFLLLGNAMMFAGFQVRNMGQAWLVLELTDSSLWVGIVNAMPGIAIISISLLGGAISDRAERWKIQVFTRLVIASMAFVTALLVTSGVIQAWHLIPIGLTTGSMFAFHNPASQAFAMDIVGRERLMNAVSLNTTLSQTATVAGPMLGGYLLATGLDSAFYLLGALYGTGFITMLMMKTRSVPVKSESRSIVREIRDGVRYAASNSTIKWLLFMSAGGLFTGIFQAVTPLYARNILDVGEVGYGTMVTVQGIGTLVGSFSLVLHGEVKHKAALIFGAMLLLNTAMTLFSFSTTYSLSLSMLFLMGMGFGVWFITVPTLIQTRTAEHMRGRVMSIFFMIALIFQLGWILGGVLDTLIGTQGATQVAAAGSMTIVMIAFASSRDLRHLT
jgi:MFS family permease